MRTTPPALKCNLREPCIDDAFNDNNHNSLACVPTESPLRTCWMLVVMPYPRPCMLQARLPVHNLYRMPGRENKDARAASGLSGSMPGPGATPPLAPSTAAAPAASVSPCGVISRSGVPGGSTDGGGSDASRLPAPRAAPPPAPSHVAASCEAVSGCAAAGGAAGEAAAFVELSRGVRMRMGDEVLARNPAGPRIGPVAPAA